MKSRRIDSADCASGDSTNLVTQDEAAASLKTPSDSAATPAAVKATEFLPAAVTATEFLQPAAVTATEFRPAAQPQKEEEEEEGESPSEDVGVKEDLEEEASKPKTETPEQRKDEPMEGVEEAVPQVQSTCRAGWRIFFALFLPLLQGLEIGSPLIFNQFAADNY